MRITRASSLALPLTYAVIVGAAVWWSFTPLEPWHIDLPSLAPAPPAANTPAPEPLNMAAFRAPLWIAPHPQAPHAVSQPTAPAPLRVQLLAILRDEGAAATFRALVYDLDADRILLVAPGDSLGPRTVEAIEQSALRISGEDGTRVLTLRNEGGGS